VIRLRGRYFPLRCMELGDTDRLEFAPQTDTAGAESAEHILGLFGALRKRGLTRR
jgi:hypothetical protein